MTHRIERSALLLGIAMVTACAQHHPSESGSDAAPPDSSTTADASPDGLITADTGVTTTDGATRPDAPSVDSGQAIPDAQPDTMVDPRMGRRPVTQDQAECLGLTQPACASCHQIGGKFFLEPVGGPPPPPDIPVTPSPMDCGVM